MSASDKTTDLSSLPSWRPAPGYFADISKNTLNSVRPSSWPVGSDISGPFCNWNTALFVPDSGVYGAFLSAGSGHLNPGAALWAGNWLCDLDTGVWRGANVPPQPMLEVTSTEFSKNFNKYGEVLSGPNAGFTYPPHHYTGLIYQSPAMGGGPKGSMIRVFLAGSGLKNCIHKFDLSQASAPPVRVVDQIDMVDLGGTYPMTALDESRGGFWVTSYNGQGPMAFVKFSDWSVSKFPNAGYNTYGGHAMIYLPAPYDCLVAFGRPQASTTAIEAYLFKIVNNVPQPPTLITQSGSPVSVTLAGVPQQTCSGGVWSKILNCIVCYPGYRSTKVFRLQPPAVNNLVVGAWIWSSETVVGDHGQIPSNPGTNPNNGQPQEENGVWSGFVENVAARCFIWCKGVNAPVQAFTLRGMDAGTGNADTPPSTGTPPDTGTTTPPSPAPAIVAFELTSPVTQAAAPFMIGHGFAKGDIPAGQYATLDLENFVVEPLTTWNDGSLKTSVIIGRAALTTGTIKQINIFKSSTAPAAGAVLTAADIRAAAPTASIQFGSFGTVSLAGLLDAPVRTFLSTREMAYCIYEAQCGADPSLRGAFYVKLWSTGQMEIRAVGKNGFLNGAEFVQKNYVPTVTIGGVMVWNNGGAVYKHSRWAGWDQLGWIGADPQITPRHDTGYMAVAKFVPNYWKKNPSAATISRFGAMKYTPGATLGFSANMGGAGFQDQLGLLPLWDALYCTSGAHPSMYNAVIDHARASRTYGICFYDKNTKKPIKISDFPRWSLYGLNQGGSPGADTIAQDGTDRVWEKAHGPSMAYLAALITGDYYHIETCCMNALSVYLCGDYKAGEGVMRSIEGQNRAKGWGRRSYGQAAAIIPTSLNGLFGDIKVHLANMMKGLTAKSVTPSYPAKWTGYEDMYGNRNTSGRARNGQMAVSTAPWEQHFGVAAMGHISDLEPCDAAGMVDLIAFRDFVEQAPVWISGGTGATEYNFGYADAYTLQFRSNKLDNFTQQNISIVDDIVAANPGQVFSDSHGFDRNGKIVNDDESVTFNAPNPSTNIIVGNAPDSAGSATAYFANLFPSLAGSVDHGQPGAAAAWARFVNAPNFFDQSVTADYDNIPIWGIVPHSFQAPKANITPAGSGAGPVVMPPVVTPPVVIPPVITPPVVTPPPVKVSKITTPSSTKLAKLKNLVVVVFDPKTLHLVKQFDGVTASSKGAITLSSSSFMTGERYAAAVCDQAGSVVLLHFPLIPQ